MYARFRMKRVFYSAYVGINENSRLPAVGTMPLLLSEHRLYQADWLMWFYGFKAAELLSDCLLYTSSSDGIDIEEELQKMNEGKELIKALDDIEKEKGISKDILLERCV